MTSSALFRNLRLTIFRNSLHVLRERSLIRVVTIIFCSLVVWGMLFGVSYRGFWELQFRTNWQLPLDGKIVCREITDDEGQDTGGSSRGNRGVRLVQ